MEFARSINVGFFTNGRNGPMKQAINTNTSTAKLTSAGLFRESRCHASFQRELPWDFTASFATEGNLNGWLQIEEKIFSADEIFHILCHEQMVKSQPPFCLA